MKIVNIQEAKTHLSRLVEEAVRGEEVVVAKAGKPLVKLAPFKAASGARVLGALAGKISQSEDCWAPDAELEAALYGEPERAPALRVAEPSA